VRETPTASRRRSREVALQVLFALDLQRCRSQRAGLPDQAFEDVADHFEVVEGAKDFARQLVRDVSRHGEQLDEAISRRARNWRVSRMAAVDRNILRLGAFELMHSDTPPAVVLNEAVELAHRFGSDASPAFVNGILDAVARSLPEKVR
jgi:N utilization substance protein B